MTGSDLGDGESVDTHDDLFARMQQGMQAKAAAQEAKEAEHNTQAAPRCKASAAQLRREAEAQQATQSMREIFRKLASALNPDRETDAQQRDIKTALMQSRRRTRPTRPTTCSRCSSCNCRSSRSTPAISRAPAPSA
ncbi:MULTISPECIES: hypothetical protein [unclassified Variovorax]|uniref:hypothetical protein n=1 Tax=unclassified Variovorax TaxID=663243 RepID=UPI0034E93490